MSKDSLRRLVRLNGDFVGTTDSQELTNKTLAAESNIIKSTTPALGNILKDNGTKYVPLTKGSAGLPLRVNDAATDVGYTALGVAGGGTGVATISSGSLLVGAGTSPVTTKAAPSGAILGDSDVQNITGAKTWTDQTLKLRNPAGTFSHTLINPAITADKSWHLNVPISYHIYKVGSTYYAKNGQTQGVDFSGATLDPVLTSVLSAITQATAGLHYSTPGGGDIYIDAGIHTLSGSFAGWTLPALCHVTFAHNAFVYVAQGYTGHVFKMIGHASGSTQHERTTIEGGYFAEAGTPQRLWTFVLFADAVGLGMYYNRIGPNIHVVNAGKFVHLRCDHATSNMNGNLFIFCTFINCVIGVLFDYNGQTPGLSTGAHRNMFLSLEGQGGANTTHGYKDIHGLHNHFIDCKIWDLTAAQISANITANASYTKIDGGIMTSLNFADLGTATQIDDDVSGKRLPSGHLRIRNPANTFEYTLKGSAIAANRDLTIPLTTANDTLAVLGVLQTYTAGMVFNNNTGISQKDTGGTTRQTLRINSSNQLDVGDIGGLSAIRFFPGHATISPLTLSSALAMTLGEGANFVPGTATGTKIGTGTTQKLAFWNATPVIQPSANADTSGATLPQLETEVNELKATLRTLGLIAP